MTSILTIKNNREYLRSHRSLIYMFRVAPATQADAFLVLFEGDDLPRALRALGLPTDPPECRGAVLLESLGVLAISTPDAPAADVAKYLYPAQVMMLEAGIERDRVANYAAALVVIANEACRRDEPVVWV